MSLRTERTFPKSRAQWGALVSKHALDDHETRMRAAYNAGLADALFVLGEFTKESRFPIPQALVDKICALEKFSG